MGIRTPKALLFKINESELGMGHNIDLESLYIAGLLHDIGKLFQRSDAEKIIKGGRKLSRFPKGHAKYSIEFIEEYKKIPVLANSDLEFIKNLIEKHHDESSSSHLIHADRVDALERQTEIYEDTEVTPDIIINERMRSPFRRDELNIYNNKSIKYDTYFPLKPLYPSEKFWETRGINDNYSDLTNNFVSFLKKYSELIGNVDVLDFVLRTFLWSVPVAVYSSAGKYIPTISLYHHSRIVAALTAISAITKGSKEGILLIGGDISGIQAFISRVSRVREVDISGIAKRLRGRSVFIELFLNAIVYALITYLNLNVTHIIYVGGGNFYIIAPNTEEVKKKLIVFEHGIQKYLIEIFNGELGLVIDYVETSFENTTKNTGSVIDKLREKIGRKKRMKFYSSFPHEYIDKEVPGELCRSCSIRPATGDDKLCDVCRDLQSIGEIIVKTIGKEKSAIVYIVSKSKETPNVEEFGELIPLIAPIEIIPDSLYIYALLIPYVRENKEFFEALFDSLGFNNAYRVFILYIRNTRSFIPDPNKFPDKYKEISKLRKIVFGWIMINNYVKLNTAGNIMSFDELATNVEEGVNLLAYIKADVDYAGFIFSRLRTLSQFMSLSSVLEIFFAGFIPSYISNKYEYSYVIFGGGDDLFIITVWDKAPKFLLDLLKFYDELSMGRSTLTASLNLFKPKFPVKSAYRIMIQNLERAKPKATSSKESLVGGKVFIFDTMVDFEKLEELIEFGDKLSQYIKENKVPRTLIFRIISLINNIKSITNETIFKPGIPVIWWPKLLYILRKLNEKHPNIVNEILNYCSNYYDFITFLVPSTYAFLKTRKMR